LNDVNWPSIAGLAETENKYPLISSPALSGAFFHTGKSPVLKGSRFFYMGDLSAPLAEPQCLV